VFEQFSLQIQKSATYRYVNGKWRSNALFVFQFYKFSDGVEVHFRILSTARANNLTLAVEVAE
jgi:hypothetical protein